MRERRRVIDRRERERIGEEGDTEGERQRGAGVVEKEGKRERRGRERWGGGRKKQGSEDGNKRGETY